MQEVAALGVALAVVVVGRHPALVCWAWRGRHDPVRHLLGGFRCRDCGSRRSRSYGSCRSPGGRATAHFEDLA